MKPEKSIKLDPSWLRVLESEFDQPYMLSLKSFLQHQKAQKKVIYPASENWFNAFNSTPFDKVRVVILGQDPYHGPGQAHGLCFSVLPGIPFPPSLLNIFKELERDIGMPRPASGCLQPWAEQGVLMLNATLTVERQKAGSHQNKGWEQFTDVAIQALEKQRENLVFILWGSYAQKKGQFINSQNHLVLKSVHPSPLSAHRGFFGCGHFSKTNQWLEQHGGAEIDWSRTT